MEEDNVILKKHPNWLKHIRFYLISVVIIILGIVFNSLLAIVFGIVVFLFIEVIRRATTYYLLESGVLREYNFLSVSKIFAEYSNIQNIEVSKTIIQNIFGIGNIKFDTSGSNFYEINFDYVSNPYEIESIVREKIKNF